MQDPATAPTDAAEQLANLQAFYVRSLKEDGTISAQIDQLTAKRAAGRTEVERLYRAVRAAFPDVQPPPWVPDAAKSRWTDEEVDRLRRSIPTPLPAASDPLWGQLAEQFGRTTTAVRKMAVDLAKEQNGAAK